MACDCGGGCLCVRVAPHMPKHIYIHIYRHTGACAHVLTIPLDIYEQHGLGWTFIVICRELCILGILEDEYSKSHMAKSSHRNKYTLPLRKCCANAYGLQCNTEDHCQNARVMPHGTTFHPNANPKSSHSILQQRWCHNPPTKLTYPLPSKKKADIQSMPEQK